ncbi:MAG: glyoxalase [Arcticibacter sp.]
MPTQNQEQPASGIFITFSGNCKEALTFYQTCFGGILHFDTFDEALYRPKKRPVLIGSLYSERITIHGSDLVHDCGRRIGNHLSIFIPCNDEDDRRILASKLNASRGILNRAYQEQKLIEVTDGFDVTWVLST